MSNKLTRQLIRTLSASYGFNPEIVEAVVRKEAGRGGFDPKTGKILIQFEPHVFLREVDPKKKAQFLVINQRFEKKEKLTEEELTIFDRWKRALNNKVELQAAEWRAFNPAFAIDPTAAISATSWGAFQILGNNYETAGYTSPEAMLDDYKLGEENQLKSFLRFINANGILRKILKKPDLSEADAALFAQFYNGNGYKSKPKPERYDTLLLNHFKNIRAGK